MYFARAVNSIFVLYYLLIIVRIFLTWIPSIDWYQQPVKFMREVTDPYLNLFRRFIPPIGGLDISPIIAIFVLSIIQGFVTGLVATLVG